MKRSSSCPELAGLKGGESNEETLPPLENDIPASPILIEEEKVVDESQLEKPFAGRKRGRARACCGILGRAMVFTLLLACMASLFMFVRGNYEALKDFQQKVLFRTWEWTVEEEQEFRFPGSWDLITTVSNQSLIPDISQEIVLTGDEELLVDSGLRRDEAQVQEAPIDEASQLEQGIDDEQSPELEEIISDENSSGACPRESLEYAVLQVCFDDSLKPTGEIEQEPEVSTPGASTLQDAGEDLHGADEVPGFVVDGEFFDDDPVETTEENPVSSKVDKLQEMLTNSVSRVIHHQKMAAGLSALGVAGALVLLGLRKKQGETEEQAPVAAEGGESGAQIAAETQAPVESPAEARAPGETLDPDEAQPPLGDQTPGDDDGGDDAPEHVYVISSRAGKGMIKPEVSGSGSSRSSNSERYGSFTTMETIDLGGAVKVTPVRRSSRIRSRSIHSPLLRA